MRDRAASHLLRIVLSAALLAVAASGTVEAEAAAQPAGPLFEWNVPSRYSGATDARGRTIETQPYEVRRGPWRVYLRVRAPACVPGATHHWTVRERGFVEREPLGRCRFVMRVPTEGRYVVHLHTTVPGKEKGEVEKLPKSRRIVVVRDFLIVAIGDSVGSGEGVPEAKSLFARAPWQSVRCHRSSRAGFARAARQIEADDGKSSVTFVHLACSGAAVRVGLLEPYAGAVRPRDEPPLEPQIDAVERLASKRQIDALLISAGANDVNFAGIATFCAFFDSSEDCFARPLPRRFGGDGARTVRESLAAAHATLREQYPRLARRIAAIEPPPERVYLTEYLDSTHDENGQLCEEFLGNIGLAEVEQARERILRPLNATVAAAARENGWTLVDGIAPAFRRHGYCADRHAWVSTLQDSLGSLGGLADRHRGALHPNPQGHEVISAFVAADLERDLFPGQDFPVRAFPEAKDDGGDDGPSTWLVVALVVGLVALVAVAIFLGPAIAAMALGAGVLLFLLWLGRDSATPLVLGFLLGALLLLALRRDKKGERSRAGKLVVAAAGPVLSLLRTLRPLLLPLLVVVAIGAAQQALVVQVLVCAALVLIAWYGIVDPEQKRSEEEAERSEAEKDKRRWERKLVLKVLLHGVVAIGLGLLAVGAIRLVGGFVNPYFETIGNIASGLLLVALLIWAVAVVLRLVSYATTPLRALLAFDVGLALVVLMMAFGIVPANEAVRDAWPPLAIVFGLAALALLAIEIAREVLAAARRKDPPRESRESRKADKPPPLPRRRWQSRVAGAGFSAAAVSAFVLAVSTVYGLVDAAGKGEPLTPPEEEVADIRTLAESGGGEAGMELARRYAPVLAFAAEERWAPMAVEPYVAAATLTGPPGTKPRKAESLAGLRCAEFGQSRCYSLSIECDSGKGLGRTGPARELCEGSAREEGRLYRSGAVYVRVLEKGKAPEGEPRGAFAAVGPYAGRLRTLVQYWYFYPYNEWRAPLFAGLLKQRHESDWEGVTIGFDVDDRPLFVGYSAHCGGTWRPWREVEATTRLPGPRTHPLVAVALGSHANYPLASEERSPDWASCSKKLPSGTATALSYASNIRDRTEYGWLWYPSPRGWREARAGEPPMSFPGLWGADGEIVLRNFQAHELAREDAPATPSLQSAWREPVRTIFCGSYEPRRCG